MLFTERPHAALAGDMRTLETHRLVIRPFTMADLADAHALLDTDLQWAGPGVSLEQRRERLAFHIELATWQDTGSIYGDRALVLKDGDVLIGICGFRPWICTADQRALYLAPVQHDPPYNSLELGIGYALSSRHRGHGYATEAVKALIEYGFTKLGVRRMVALAGRGNTASVNVMRRAGMRIGINPDPEAVYPWAVGIIEAEPMPIAKAAGD